MPGMPWSLGPALTAAVGAAALALPLAGPAPAAAEPATEPAAVEPTSAQPTSAGTCHPWSKTTVASGLGILENIAFDGRGSMLVSAQTALGPGGALKA